MFPAQGSPRQAMACLTTAPRPRHVSSMSKPPLEILLAAPRGFCAGVVQGDRHRRAGAERSWRARLCAPRDRPQQIRGR